MDCMDSPKTFAAFFATQTTRLTESGIFGLRFKRVYGPFFIYSASATSPKFRRRQPRKSECNNSCEYYSDIIVTHGV